jgi:Dynamin family
MSDSPAPATVTSDVVDRTIATADLAASAGRDDLAVRLRTAAARVRRPATVVCVVGEFKQGKSSLVNALLGEAICPIDDDLATSALTLVRYGDTRLVEVRRRVDDTEVVEQIEPDALADWVTEAGNPDNAKGVERVDLSLPSELLAQGLVIVDTPGMGSMGAGHGAATLAFLPWADALIFVSDASAELSQPELAFLHQARDLCPTVVFALTKTDLSPEWRRIAELDAHHLAEADTEVPTVPVSAALRDLAFERRNRALNDQSGFPELLRSLDVDVIGPAKQLAADRAEAETMAVLDQLATAARSELEMLEDPDRRREIADRAHEATAKLEHLRGPGSRWSLLVGDRVTDLSNDVTFHFRGALRQVTRSLEDEIEDLKTPKDWDELGRRLQTEVAEAVTQAFQRIERGATDIEAAVIELLAEDLDGLPSFAGDRDAIDVRTLWSDKGVDPKGGRGGQALGTTLVGMRGAQSGIIMFGMMARFLPAGVGAVLLATPVTLGLGAAFAGFQLYDAHKRKLAQRRQQARMNVRQFTDDVQFEISNAIGEVLRGMQRTFRDGLGDRVAELQRTYADVAKAAIDAAQRDDAESAARASQLREELSSIAALAVP